MTETQRKRKRQQQKRAEAARVALPANATKPFVATAVARPDALPAAVVTPIPRGEGGQGGRSAFATGRLRASSADAPTLDRPGFYGTSMWSGLIQQDYNPALHFPRSVSTYQRMRCSDPMVATVENIIGLPVRTVRWRVDPGDKSKASQEAAAMLEQNLLQGHGMSHSFDDLLRMALVAPMIGWQNIVKWHAEDRGYIKFETFLDVHPQTLKAWIPDDAGRVTGFSMTGTDANGHVREEIIPPEKAMRFTFREEWGNPEGFPLCRTMYAPWYIKRTLYLILNIGMEREWVGTPKGKYPKGTTKDDQHAFLESLKRLVTTANGAIIYEDGYDLDTYVGHAKTDSAMAYLQHLDDAIAKIALAAFINLVGSGQGSRALSSDQSAFFMQCEQALASWVCAVINQQAIRQLVLWNFPNMPDVAIPRLAHSHVSTVLQPVALGHALAALVNKQLLTPDTGVENSVREMLNLPPMPEGQQRNQPRQPDQPSPDPKLPPTKPESRRPSGAGGSALLSATSLPSGRSAPPSATSLPSPLPTGEGGSGVGDAETTPEDFADLPVREQFKSQLPQIKADLDAAQEQFIAAGHDILDKSLVWAETRAAELADRAAALPPLQRGTVHIELAALELPYRGEYEDWLQGMMMDLVKAGLDQVNAVRRVGGGDGVETQTIPNELRSFCRAKARVTADLHFEQLRAALVYRAQQDIEGKLGRDQVRFNVRQVLREQASASVGAGMMDIMRQVADQVAGVYLSP